MVKDGYLISEVAKEVSVENHVLRYWEEELELPVKRTPQGHRYYTKEDVERFIYIKELKEQGMQLKAIRTILRDEGLNRENTGEKPAKSTRGLLLVNTMGSVKKQPKEVTGITEMKDMNKVHRLQILLQAMIAEAVSENNQVLCESIQEIVQKEMDYQYRQIEDKEEEREERRKEREEEHYHRIDDLLRERGMNKSGKNHRSFLWIK